MTTKVTADGDGERPQAAVTRRDLPIASAVARQDRGEGEPGTPTSQDATVTDIPVAGPEVRDRRDAEAKARAEAEADAGAETGSEAGSEADAAADADASSGSGDAEPQEARPAARPARTTRVDVKVIDTPETRLDVVSDVAGASEAPADPAPAEEEAAAEEEPVADSPAAEASAAEPDPLAESAGTAGPAGPADAVESSGLVELADATTVDPPTPTPAPVEEPVEEQVEEPVHAPAEVPVEAAAPVIPRPSAPLPSETMVEPLPAPSASSPPASVAAPAPLSPPVAGPAPASASAQNWHRYHLAVGAFLVAYCAAGLIGTVLGWPVRRGEIASYLDGTIGAGAGAGAATPALLVIKVVEVFLTVVALAGVLRRKDVWYLPALTGWIAGFAVFCALDVWVGKTGRLIEHGVYLVLFGALLFGSYALSVKVRVTRATAPGSGRPAATANLSRTQEIALAALDRWQR